MNSMELKVRVWQHHFYIHRDNKTFQRIWTQVRNLVTAPYQQFPECSADHWDSVKMTAVLDGLLEYDSKHLVVTQQAIEIPIQVRRKKIIRIPVIIERPGKPAIISFETREIEVTEHGRKKLKIIETERESVMTLLSFLRFKMEQAIKAEKRVLIAQRRDVALDNTYTDGDSDGQTRGDEICFKQLVDQKKLFPTDPINQERVYLHLIKAVENALKTNGDPRILRTFQLKLKTPAITNRQIAKTLGISKTYITGYFHKLHAIMLQVMSETETAFIREDYDDSN